MPECHELKPKAAGNTNQEIYLEGEFLLLFLWKGQEDLGLIPRSQNHRLELKKLLTIRQGFLAWGSMSHLKFYSKLWYLHSQISSDSQRGLSLKTFNGPWANLCHPFPFPQPPTKAHSGVTFFEYYSLLTPVSCHLHLHHIVLSKSSS